MLLLIPGFYAVALESLIFFTSALSISILIAFFKSVLFVSDLSTLSASFLLAIL